MPLRQASGGGFRLELTDDGHEERFCVSTELVASHLPVSPVASSGRGSTVTADRLLGRQGRASKSHREGGWRGTIMEEMDFERRRELRRQKREEMRLEAERLARNDDDEEEAARERRRRARQERMRSRESEEPSLQPESLVLTNSHSVTETVSMSSSYGGGADEDQALLDRMAKREERRERRMKEALERQRQTEPTATEGADKNDEDEERGRRRGRYRDDEDEEKTLAYSSRREEKVQEEQREEEEELTPEAGEEADEGIDEEEPKVEELEDKPRRAYFREQESAEEPKMPNEELGDGTRSVATERSDQAKSADSERGECAVASQEDDTVHLCNSSENKPVSLGNDTEEDNGVSETLHSEDNEVSERGGSGRERDEQRRQNGGAHEEPAPKQHRKPERTLSRGSAHSPEAAGDDQDDGARLEAERKLEELKRRRDDAESEEFERMRQKQQEAEAELEELKRKREERRKVLEEEERQRKQEEQERKAKEEEEKRKMKEEIERRRAQAAEKRQKGEEAPDGDDKPFKCVSPRGSALKIGERTEFLNKSAQKSAVKSCLSPTVSKIDNRLEQYTSAAQRENKESRSPRPGAADLPPVTDSIRNIKSMWEKGNAFGPAGGGGSPFKEAAVIKTGVAGRINDWLNKTPESCKAPGARPADLKPVDVTNKRSLWENKGAPTTKVAGRGETKSVANGMGH
ncbi:caldesmon 1a isoform X2 [Betta splendens]|uniref:Caldesmon 1a isoform X2 n=1 Tax=Betta splendens TaxID=158456 RepID=A0A9W2XZR4_BETSP|nr:caldesmon 1a isoform X2 [Betta splendens]